MKKQLIACAAFALLTACSGSKTTTAEADKFDYTVEQFADLQILRYRVPGFENLSLQQKELVYYLTEAALQGRDILFDQNGKYNLRIRRTLEAVYTGSLMAFIIIMVLRSSCRVLLPNFSKRLC